MEDNRDKSRKTDLRNLNGEQVENKIIWKAPRIKLLVGAEVEGKSAAATEMTANMGTAS